jgi:hypothetical protein
VQCRSVEPLQVYVVVSFVELPIVHISVTYSGCKVDLLSLTGKLLLVCLIGIMSLCLTLHSFVGAASAQQTDHRLRRSTHTHLLTLTAEHMMQLTDSSRCACCFKLIALLALQARHPGQRVHSAAAATAASMSAATKLQAFWNHPAGPKTSKFITEHDSCAGSVLGNNVQCLSSSTVSAVACPGLGAAVILASRPVLQGLVTSRFLSRSHMSMGCSSTCNMASARHSGGVLASCTTCRLWQRLSSGHGHDPAPWG